MYKVGDLLKHLKQSTVYFIAPNSSITDAKDYMKERRIGAVSVKAKDELVGILTERSRVLKLPAGSILLTAWEMGHDRHTFYGQPKDQWANP